MADLSDLPELPELPLSSHGEFSVLFEPTPPAPLDLDAYRVFQTALPERDARVAIGLHIPDAEAQVLLRDAGWQESYYRQWLGEPVTTPLGAPVAHPRISTGSLAARVAASETAPSVATAKSKQSSRVTRARRRPSSGSATAA